LKLKNKIKGWSEIGWQGIRFPVPEDWHLASVQGNRTKGYLRVDDDESVRLEIRWEKPAKRPEDFGPIAERLLDQMEKFSRRKKSPFTLRRNVPVAAPPGKQYEGFETRGDTDSCGCLTRCAHCGRIVLCRVLGDRRANIRELAKKIFEETVDHPLEDNLDHWNLYGLEFDAPADFVMQSAKMRTGALELSFTGGKKELDIRRLSLASLVLKDRSLKNFFVNYCYKELKYFEYKTAEVELPGKNHTAVGLTGKQTLKARLLSHAGGKRFVHAFAWVCDDRIYMFKMTSPLAEDPQFFELAGRVDCHHENGAS